MGDTKAGHEKVRVLQKNNTGTYSVSLPIELVRLLRWQSGQKLTIEKRGRTIIISDQK